MQLFGKYESYGLYTAEESFGSNWAVVEYVVWDAFGYGFVE
jgi:hypothetical protein